VCPHILPVLRAAALHVKCKDFSQNFPFSVVDKLAVLMTFGNDSMQHPQMEISSWNNTYKFHLTPGKTFYFNLHPELKNLPLHLLLEGESNYSDLFELSREKLAKLQSVVEEFHEWFSTRLELGQFSQYSNWLQAGQLDDWGLIPGSNCEFFSSTPCPDWHWGPPILLSNGLLGPLSLGVKWPGCEADHSPPSSAESKE